MMRPFRADDLSRYCARIDFACELYVAALLQAAEPGELPSRELSRAALDEIDRFVERHLAVEMFEHLSIAECLPCGAF